MKSIYVIEKETPKKDIKELIRVFRRADDLWYVEYHRKQGKHTVVGHINTKTIDEALGFFNL